MFLFVVISPLFINVTNLILVSVFLVCSLFGCVTFERRLTVNTRMGRGLVVVVIIIEKDEDSGEYLNILLPSGVLIALSQWFPKFCFHI